jgi:EmrB/QacA subfamily drug resistance transporter
MKRSHQNNIVQRYLKNRVAYKWQVLLTVGIGAIMSTIDVGMISTAYPTLTVAFSSDPSVVVWTGLAFFLMSIGLLLTMGWLSDSIGRDRVFLTGLIVWTVTLGLSATATNIYQLIAYRALQGVGAAMTISTLNALLVDAFPERQRGLALGLGGVFVGLGAGLGPFAGGLILSNFDWPALFYFRVPLGLMGIIFAWTLLNRERPRGQAQADYRGAVLIFLALTTLIIGINQAGRIGIGHPIPVTALVLSVLLIPAIIHTERRAIRPVLDLGLFREPNYRGGVVSLVLTYQSWTTVLLLLPFLMINGMGFSVFKAGLFLTSYSILRLGISPIAGWITDRIGPRPLMTTGVLFATGGLIFLSRINVSTPEITLLLAIVLTGIGTTLFDPSNASAVMGSVPRSRLGTAAASIATARQIGLSAGVVLATAIFAARSAAYAGIEASRFNPNTLPLEALTGGIRDALLIGAAVTALAVFFTTRIQRRKNRAQPTSFEAHRHPKA